jgi:hypothetical protein
MTNLINKVKSLINKKAEPTKVNSIIKPKIKKKGTSKLSINKRAEGLQQLKDSVIQNGYHSLKVKSLFNLFGYLRKGPSNIQKVNTWLKENGLYALPKISDTIKSGTNIKIYNFPVEQLGELFDKEQIMEDKFFKHRWFEKLNLQIESTLDQQYKPTGTRDRLDFKAKDALGNHVVVELKKGGGDKRLIEQAFRYRSLLMTDPKLKNELNCEDIYCIVITGVRCLHTARAIHGLSADKQKKIKWYLYDYNSSLNSIDFKEVTLDFINKHLPA